MLTEGVAIQLAFAVKVKTLLSLSNTMAISMTQGVKISRRAVLDANILHSNGASMTELADVYPQPPPATKASTCSSP